MAEIEFDPDTYEPLPVYKPAATRAQAARAVQMINEAERPVIVSGGGVFNADASDKLRTFAELLGVPVIPTLMGWGVIPDDHPLMAGMVGLQTSHATPARWMSTPRAASSCISISSLPRSAKCSARTSALCPTRAWRWI
jgi:glyoxylate carboligase